MRQRKIVMERGKENEKWLRKMARKIVSFGRTGPKLSPTAMVRETINKMKKLGPE